MWIALPSFLTVVLSGFVTYALRLTPNDEPKWLTNWVIEHRASAALWLLILTLLVALLDLLRAWVGDRHRAKKLLQDMLNDLSKVLVGADGRNNRITLFKLTSGWRTILWSAVKLPMFSKVHKWRAVLRLRPRRRYVGVYLRSQDSRGRNSATAFRVSDDPQECEGVAGLIWDRAAQVMIPNLPRMDRDAVRRVENCAQLAAEDPIRKYVEATNISDIRLLRACDNFGRHFYGTLIRKSDGAPWGILLLDSVQEVCPFMTNGTPSQDFVQRFNDYARLIGMVVR